MNLRTIVSYRTSSRLQLANFFARHVSKHGCKLLNFAALHCEDLSLSTRSRCGIYAASWCRVHWDNSFMWIMGLLLFTYSCVAVTPTTSWDLCRKHVMYELMHVHTVYVHAHAHAPVRTMYRCSMHGTKPLYSKSASSFGPKHHAMRVVVNRSLIHAAAPSSCGRRQSLKLLVHESMCFSR